MICEWRKFQRIGNNGSTTKKKGRLNRSTRWKLNEELISKKERRGNSWKWSWKNKSLKLRLSKLMLVISSLCSYKNARVKSRSLNWILRIWQGRRLGLMSRLSPKPRSQPEIKTRPFSLLKTKAVLSLTTILRSTQEQENWNIKMTVQYP